MNWRKTTWTASCRKNKNDAEAYRLRGSALLGMNQIRPALSDFSMSIARQPVVGRSLLSIAALAYRKLGRTEDADADLEKAMQLDPEVGRRQ